MSADSSNYYKSLIHKSLLPLVEGRQREIEGAITMATKNIVQSGPFAGMELCDEVSWHGGDLTPKLLGCYEQELHPAIMALKDSAPDRVVNVGCAEGYYTVGLARFLPSTTVFAFDLDEQAQTLCRRAATLNKVAERVHVSGACHPGDLQALCAPDTKTLLVIDCEGGELQLLDPNQAPALAKCNIIVECHDFIIRTISETLKGRFSPTHTIQQVREGARDPAALPILRNLSTLDRWLAVCENRPEVMTWLVMTVKS